MERHQGIENLLIQGAIPEAFTRTSVAMKVVRTPIG